LLQQACCGGQSHTSQLPIAQAAEAAQLVNFIGCVDRFQEP